MVEEITRFVVNEFGTNCYIYKDIQSEFGLVIDPGGEPQQILNFLKTNKIKLQHVVLTHAHYDHIKSLEDILEVYPVEVVIHEEELSVILDDAQNLSLLFGTKAIKKHEYINWLKVKDMDIITCGQQDLYVLHTPGHTKGSICLYIKDKYLFTGDTLFCGSVGRTDFPTGDITQLDNSLKRIFSLPKHVEFFPGHNNPCVLSEEITHNPFVKMLY